MNTPLPRHSLFDNGSDSFEVNISRLDSEDEGLYQCAVDIPLAKDVYEEVYVDVSDEEETKGYFLFYIQYVFF